MFYFFFFEFGALLTFILILARERKNRGMVENIFLALIYGLILEIFNTHLSGSYSYSSDFILRIFDVPLAIGIGWAVIYYAASKTAENYRLKWWQEPFLMAFIALSIDLAFDVIAIRLGFWQWRIPFSQEWYGVPYDNLLGWLAVVWTFAFIVNLSKQNFFKRKISRIIKYSAVIISPILLSLQITIFVTLAAIFSGRFTFTEILGFYERRDFSYAYYPEVQTFKLYIFWLFVAALVIYLAKVIYANRKNIKPEIDRFSFSILTGMHILFLAVIFIAGLYKQNPIFILIAVLMLAAHLAVSFLFIRRR